MCPMSYQTREQSDRQKVGALVSMDMVHPSHDNQNQSKEVHPVFPHIRWCSEIVPGATVRMSCSVFVKAKFHQLHSSERVG